MKIHYALPAVLIALACAGAFLATGEHHPELTPHPKVAQHYDTAVDITHDTPGARVQHDAIALDDLRVRAAHHDGGSNIDVNTLAVDYHWQPAWELRCVDTVPGGESVHLCHAIDKHDPHRRFIAVWDPAHSVWSDWEVVH